MSEVSIRSEIMETHNLTEQEIAALYPKFRQWIRGVKRYMSVGGVYTIILWYEFLKGLDKEKTAV